MTDFADASGSSAPAASARRGSTRALRQRPIVRARRGAILVWAGVLVLALVGFGAFAVDFGSFYVTAAELQTAADAAALAGARTLQVSTLTGTARAAAVDARAVAVANTNQAWGSALSINGDSVHLRYWDPVTRTASATAPAGFDLNAVEVRTGRSTSFLFGHVLKNTFGVGNAPNVNRRAVAWIANFNNGNCVLPFALPYKALYDRVTAITGIANTDPDQPRPPLYAFKKPDLSQAQLAKLADLPLDAQRLIIFRPPYYDGQGGKPDSTQALGNMNRNDGRYSAYNLLGTASPNAYQSGIITCSAAYLAVGGAINGTTLPGANALECYTVNALMGSGDQTCNMSQGWPTGSRPNINQAVTCYYKTTTAPYDAGCYSSATFGTQGIMKNATWGDSTTVGSNESTFRVVGKIKIYCVFRLDRTDASNAGKTEVCNTDDATVKPSNYPMGTIVGVIQGLDKPALQANTELGNIKGDQQKLILVQ